jgi:hypothetical protein
VSRKCTTKQNLKNSADKISITKILTKKERLIEGTIKTSKLTGQWTVVSTQKLAKLADTFIGNHDDIRNLLKASGIDSVPDHDINEVSLSVIPYYIYHLINKTPKSCYKSSSKIKNYWMSMRQQIAM